MTNNTDQDAAFRFAKTVTRPVRGVPKTEDMLAAARYILANVEAPAPTLAEELIRMANEAQDEMRYADEKDLSDLAHRAEQIEQENEEQRGWNLSVNEQAGVLACERDEAREALAVEGRRVEKIAAERDRARAEVRSLQFDKLEGLTAFGWMEQAKSYRAEMNAATVASEENVAADQQANMQGILAGSPPNPADVKPGEAWLVEVNGKRGTAVKDCGRVAPWSVVINGAFSSRCNEFVTLLSRMVPAPRVIGNADELDALEATSIIRDGRGWPGGVTSQGAIMINGSCYSDEELFRHGPVTVLWEPGA